MLRLEAAASLTSRFRPGNRLIALTSRPETWRGLCLSWGILPLLPPPAQDIDEMLRLAEEVTVQAGLLRAGGRLITTGAPGGSRGAANLIKAATIT